LLTNRENGCILFAANVKELFLMKVFNFVYAYFTYYFTENKVIAICAA
jgi:hypothetical protein